MSILNHPRWSELRQYLTAQPYGPDTSGIKTRYRFEVASDAPPWVFDVLVPCACCFQPMHPVRQRESGGVYLAVACPHEVKRSCANGLAAAMECEQLVAALAGQPVITAPTLFDE